VGFPRVFSLVDMCFVVLVGKPLDVQLILFVNI
jgi:hypothetical protein